MPYVRKSIVHFKWYFVYEKAAIMWGFFHFFYLVDRRTNKHGFNKIKQKSPWLSVFAYKT